MSNDTDMNTLGNAFAHSCYFEKVFGHEQFISDHVVMFQISGETHIDTQNGIVIISKNQMVIARRLQLAKAYKYPAKDEAYRVMSVVLHTERLQKYALNNHINTTKIYNGDLSVSLKSNAFLENYFRSLVPYVENTKEVSKQMENLKVNELVTLLLENHPELKTFLFDFSEPFKVDLEDFMGNNFHYNVPIENFAKLTGRSLASFKRDFKKIFQTSPRKWLQDRRLKEAYTLLEKKQQKPADIYLDLGFENLSHFYSSFKEKFGITPATVLSK